MNANGFDPIATAHELRKAVDANIQAVEKFANTLVLTNLPPAEAILALRKLQEGKMWLGKVLEVLGSPFPAELADKAVQNPVGGMSGQLGAAVAPETTDNTTAGAVVPSSTTPDLNQGATAQPEATA